MEMDNSFPMYKKKILRNLFHVLMFKEMIIVGALIKSVLK